MYGAGWHGSHSLYNRKGSSGGYDSVEPDFRDAWTAGEQ